MENSRLEVIEKIARIFQSIATVFAIIIGAIWTYSTFVMHRESVSKANISHHVEDKKLSNEHIFLKVKIKVENVGKTAINLIEGRVYIEDVSFPNGYIEKQIDSCLEPCFRKDPVYAWNVIQDVSFKWSIGERIIEPSSFDTLYCEFIINQKYNLVKIYSHFTDKKKFFEISDGDINAVSKIPIGWSASTLHNIQAK